MQQELILSGTVVSMKDCIYKPDIFEMEDETARQIAQRLLSQYKFSIGAGKEPVWTFPVRNAVKRRSAGVYI